MSHCETLADRVAILDAPLHVDDIELLAKAGTATAGGVAARPQGRKGAAGDAGPPDEKPGLRPQPSMGGFGAFYFPWITVMDPLGDTTHRRPAVGSHGRDLGAHGCDPRRPQGAGQRGRPRRANVTYRLTRDEQGVLNDGGVNCIRYFPREGIRVWGARTLADAASEWRYLNVRRLFNMIEESIAEGTRWIVFEPNDRTLWKSHPARRRRVPDARLARRRADGPRRPRRRSSSSATRRPTRPRSSTRARSSPSSGSHR